GSDKTPAPSNSGHWSPGVRRHLDCAAVMRRTKVGAMFRQTLALALLVASIVGPRPVRAGQPPEIEYRNDRLTLHAHDTPITAILDEVKRQSGAEVRGAPAVTSVTVDLDAVPLREALERLLGPRSFTLTYGEHGRLKAIELRGGPQAAPV